MISSRSRYRFTIARFMPNQLRGEFVNIGVVLHVLDTQQILTRWSQDLNRMQNLSPTVELEEYRYFQDHVLSWYYYRFRDQFAKGDDSGLSVVERNKDRETITPASAEFLDCLHQAWSVPFQFSEPVPGLLSQTDQPQRQLHYLYGQFVQSPGE